jgi:hypothetical protein
MMPWHLSSFASGEATSSKVGVSGVSKICFDLTKFHLPLRPIPDSQNRQDITSGFVGDGKTH